MSCIPNYGSEGDSERDTGPPMVLSISEKLADNWPNNDSSLRPILIARGERPESAGTEPFVTQKKFIRVRQRQGYAGGEVWAMSSSHRCPCLLYTSDAADERSSVDLGGRRIIK